MTDKILNSQAFKLKGRMHAMTVLQFLNTDEEIFVEQLKDVTAKAPKLFEQAPLVLDFSSINSEQIDLSRICRLIREHGLLPVAVQGGGSMLSTLAQCQGLAVLSNNIGQDKVITDKVSDSQQNQVQTSLTKVITSPVRSGQQVVGKNCDIIVTSSVGHGAEILSDGNIHVYGMLRGRALAGISGDKSVRIFCQSLEAELVSIAGIYRLSDAIDKQSGPCQIYLKDDRIQIESL